MASDRKRDTENVGSGAWLRSYGMHALGHLQKSNSRYELCADEGGGGNKAYIPPGRPGSAQFHSVLMGVLPSGGGACAINPAIMVGEHLLLRGAISQASNWKQPRRISF